MPTPAKFGQPYEVLGRRVSAPETGVVASRTKHGDIGQNPPLSFRTEVVDGNATFEEVAERLRPKGDPGAMSHISMQRVSANCRDGIYRRG
jgi:hypothetical protein